MSVLQRLLFARPAAAYPTHVPLTGLQQGALTVLSALGALASPRRADLVAAVGETSAGPALAALRRRMTLDPRGADILAERPRVTDALLRRAAALPPDTFGGAYAAFMGTRGFSADERPPVRFVADAELAYIVTRAREVHDFWHVLFGCHTNVQGEVALKAVEFLQTGLPMTALAVVAGELRLPAEQRAELNRTYLPWALQAGAQAADLMCIPYEKHLEDNLDELRRRYRIIIAPATAGAAARAGSPTPPLGAAPPGFEGLGPGVEGGTAAQLHETSGRLGPV